MKKCIIFFVAVIVLCTAGIISASAQDAEINLYCNQVPFVGDSYDFFGVFDMEYSPSDTATSKPAMAIIAYYTPEGTVKSIELVRGRANETMNVSSSINSAGTVKCMVVDAATLSPLCGMRELEYRTEINVNIINIWDGEIGNPDKPVRYLEIIGGEEKYSRIYTNESTEVFVNEKKLSTNKLDLWQKYADLSAEIRFVENTNDKYCDKIYISVYEHNIVAVIDRNDMTITGVDGTVIDFNRQGSECEFFDTNGNVSDIDCLNPGDVIAMVVTDKNNENEYLPVSAQQSQDKITVYNLGDNTFSGRVTAMVYDDREMYINDQDNKYYYASDIVLCHYDIEDWLGLTFDFYVGKTGEIIGLDDSAHRKENFGQAGIILNSYYDESWFDPCYRMTILCENGEIVKYIGETKIRIDGQYCDVSEQKEYLELGKLDYSNYNDLSQRCVRFESRTNGSYEYIKKLNFVSRDTSVEYVSGYTTAMIALGYKTLYINPTVFDISDEANCRAGSADILDSKYQYDGYLLDCGADGQHHVFAATACALAPSFENEGSITIVDGVINTTYDNDDITIYYPDDISIINSDLEWIVDNVY